MVGYINSHVCQVSGDRKTYTFERKMPSLASNVNHAFWPDISATTEYTSPLLIRNCYRIIVLMSVGRKEPP